MIWIALTLTVPPRVDGMSHLSLGVMRIYRLGGAKRRTAESVSGSRGSPIARGANWGARSRRALALPGIARPQRATAGPITGVLRRRAVNGAFAGSGH
jgi:hypothetical protein